MTSFFIPLFVLCALVLNILVSTAPMIPGLDITARTHFNEAAVEVNGIQGLTEIRFGIWTPCFYDLGGRRQCQPNSLGYNLTITGADLVQAEIQNSLTRALILHPIAAAVSIIALLFTIIPAFQITSTTLVITFLAALATLVAFVIDIAFFVIVQKAMKVLGPGVTTSITAPGFWLALAAFVLLLFAYLAIYGVRRRDKDKAKKQDKLILEVAARLTASVYNKKKR